MIKILSSLSLPLLLSAFTYVVPDNYLIHQEENLSYLYSKEYQEVLPKIKNYQKKIIKQYTQEYGYALDSPLYVALASSKNQIANGFATPIPLNSQVFYDGGAGMIDYFCFDSWLKTLLIHETAHTFQLNPKENIASKVAHTVVGNTPLTFLGLLPLFPIPNITESSFVFEGNAVMNESRFGNGGRLYSGYALAEVITQARANQITPELIYNETLSFPYGERFYLIGGFFQQFLVKRYGIERVNGYFKTYAKQMLPLFSNSIFKEQFGKTFKTLLAEFVKELISKHQNFTPTQGELIATSQGFEPMNRTDDEIYALIGSAYDPHQILSLDRDTQQRHYYQGAWKRGEPFKIGEQYYTQTSAKISPTQITMGLFDAQGYLKKESASKIIQGYLSNKEAVYFDLNHSLDRPHIYVGGGFYDETSSSVFVDSEDNLYYFKQKGEQRTLYRNKKPLYSFVGHYGFVVDVDHQNRIYFISNSPDGSTAYCYHNKEISRVDLGDDIIDLKLINDHEAVVATITAKEYRYLKVALRLTPATLPQIDLSMPKDHNTTITQKSTPSLAKTPLKSQPYRPLTQLHYSYLDQAMGYINGEGFFVNLRANFTDPLNQNTLATTLAHNSDHTIMGISYTNEAQPLEYGLSLYGVKHQQKTPDERNHGYDAHIDLPLIAEGYFRALMQLSYTKSYATIYRKPWSLSVDLLNNKQFGLSKYPNHLNHLKGFFSHDRDNNSMGIAYEWMHDLPSQSYLGINLKHLQSYQSKTREEKGIRISDSVGEIQQDPSTIIAPTLNSTLYAKELTMGEMGLYKVFETPFYFYSFPISLRRESLYLKQRHYVVGLDHKDLSFDETILGIESDLLFFHKIPLPLSLELLYNDKAKESLQFRFLFGIDF
jgi:hypothetical protein